MNSSAARTLQILNIIGDSTTPLGLSQIARELGGPLSNVARGIEALERTGFVQRYQASAQYVLGEAAKNLRQSAIGRFRLRDLALPYLRQLAFASGETSTLVVRVGWFAVRIASVAGPNEAVRPLPSAMAEPILQNAGGRAIIAMESSEYANRLLEEFAPKDAAAQRREFSAIRKRGFAISATPLAPGHAALAFPVMGESGPVGAIHLEGPVCRSVDFEPRDEVERWKGIVAEISGIVRDRPDMGINPFGEIDAHSVALKID